MSMLDVDRLVVRLGGRTILDGVSLRVDAGETLALQGPSGSGKSTLLRVVAGILQPSSGRVMIGGADVTRLPTHRRGVGMVFQDEQLFPHLDVAGNVGFGLRMAGIARVERSRRVAELLELVGLADLSARNVDSLSGGERKRVAVARSLATRPAVLLLDEPLTGLDAALHDRLVAELVTLLAGVEVAAVWVTHDAGEADAVGSRVAQIGSLAQARDGLVDDGREGSWSTDT